MAVCPLVPRYEPRLWCTMNRRRDEAIALAAAEHDRRRRRSVPPVSVTVGSVQELRGINAALSPLPIPSLYDDDLPSPNATMDTEGVEVSHASVEGGATPQIAELNNKLSQYTRGADRRQALRTLADPSLLPRMHQLRNVRVEDIAAAEREATGERAVLNGVKFLQVKSRPADDAAPVDSYFLSTLREICGHMCDMDGVDADPMALYGGLLLRLARTVSERDALETTTRWICGKGELVVLPLKRRHHGGEGRCPAPVELEVFVEGGNVHAKVTMRHEMGVHQRTNLEANEMKEQLKSWSKLVAGRDDETTQEAIAKKLAQIQYECLEATNVSSLKPWIFLDADVVERINFGTGSSVRMLHLSIPDDKNSGYVKNW